MASLKLLPQLSSYHHESENHILDLDIVQFLLLQDFTNIVDYELFVSFFLDQYRRQSLIGGS